MAANARRRHVVVLNQFALPLSQGGGTRHTELFSRLDGWSHTIIAGERNHYSQEKFTTDDPAFRLVKVPSQKGGGAARLAGWLAYSAQAFWRTVREPRVDAVYASTPHPLAPLAGWAAAKVKRAPFVLEVRDLWPESIVSVGKLKEGSPVHRVLSAVERFSVNAADQVVGVTTGWEDHFARLGDTPFQVIPNGAEFVGRSSVSADNAESLRPAVEGPCGIFAGAHGPKDGIDAILDAAAQHPCIGFALMGNGVMKEPARKRVRAEGLDNVKFLDPVPKSQLADVLSAFDFGIHAVTPLGVFEKGMSPNKLFDYMAHDLPVVSNAGRALDAVVGDAPVGAISTDLVQAVGAYCDATASDQESWSNNRRLLMSGPYSRDASSEKLREVLERVVKVGRKRR